MRRREFIALIGGAALAWPRATRAQPLPRIGMLYATAENDSLTSQSLSVFRAELTRLGWMEGKNVAVDYRFTGEASRLPQLAEELVALHPNVIFASTTPCVKALRRVTATIPIVFVSVANPIANGIVQDLARPGGNITGFANSVGATPLGKHLELLRELVPNLSRAAIMYNPNTVASVGSTDSLFSTAVALLKIEPLFARVRSDGEIDVAIEALGREPKAGLIVTQDVYVANHRAAIIESAARHQVPAAYPFKFYCSDGGLMSYGVDVFVGHGAAATYIDRILKGEKPGDLPVQQPTKLELVINLKTAKALGLTVPPSLLARADEVIE